MDIKRYGLDLPLTAIPNRRWICSICQLLMNDPIQTYRGARACRACYVEAKGSSKLCPIDKKPIKDNEFYQDIFAHWNITHILTRCTHTNCKWTGFVKDAPLHTKTCLHRPTNCNICHSTMPFKDLETHNLQLCPLRTVVCKICGTFLIAKNTPTHSNLCPAISITCPHCKIKKITTNDGHLEKCLAVHTPKTCPFQNIGCKVTPNDLPVTSHIALNQHKHAVLLAAGISELHRSSNIAHHFISEERKLNQEFTQLVTRQQEQIDEQQSTITTMQQNISELRSTLTNLALVTKKTQRITSDNIASMFAILTPSTTHPQQPSSTHNHPPSKLRKLMAAPHKKPTQNPPPST